MRRPLPEIRFITRWGSWLVGLIAAWGFLYRLDGLSIREWDEGRLAVNALEMARSGNWIVTTFGFEPDLWNVKPPLMIWCQAGLICLLGPDEWAVRLPAACAALVTCGLLYGFAVRYLRRPLTGVLTVSALVSMLGFLGEHHAHTGDYDALLVLGVTGFSLALFLFLDTRRAQYWWPTVLGLCVATLTKGIAGLLCLPGLAAYCTLRKRWLRVLRAPGFWLTALVWLLVVAAWYGLREHARPGYLHAVWLNELGGRFTSTLEKNDGPWYYYLFHMGRAKMLPWFWLLPVVLPFALTHPDARTRRAAWFALCWVLGLLLTLTVARTKLLWYVNPAYPWLALLVGIGGPRAAAWLLARVPASRRVAHVGLRALLVALLLVPPLVTIIHELRGVARDNQPDERPGYFLRALNTDPPLPAPLYIVWRGRFNTALRPPTALHGDSGYNAPLRFYLLASPHPDAGRVVPPAAVATLRGPAFVLTTSAADSAVVRNRLGAATPRVVPGYQCYLWHLSATGKPL